MNVAVFASGNGNNLLTAIKTAELFPDELKIVLVVTDRLEIPAIEIAKNYGLTVIAKNFEKECGVWEECKHSQVKTRLYQEAAKRFHDDILDEIKTYQQMRGSIINLVALSYHRLIRGKLLKYFQDKIINQHPADLAVMKDKNHFQRKYVGLSGLFKSLKDGKTKTRTCNFIVRKGLDDGEILCSGPWVNYQGPLPVTRKSAWNHELRQKKLSDQPCLKFVLIAISRGRYGIHRTKKHPDGNKVITFDGQPLRYQGIDL